MFGRRYAAVILLLFAACMRSESEPHPAFVAGTKTLERVTGETLDHDFGHPDFDLAAQQFGQVPANDPNYTTAQTLRARILAGRQRYEESARAAEATKQTSNVEAAIEAARREAAVERQAVEGRLDAEARERARVAEERQRDIEYDRRAKVAREEADQLTEARNERAAAQREAERARTSAVQRVKTEKESCTAARVACRERCLWVRDGTGRTGGLGSPISMQCMQSCPICE